MNVNNISDLRQPASFPIKKLLRTNKVFYQYFIPINIFSSNNFENELIELLLKNFDSEIEYLITYEFINENFLDVVMLVTFIRDENSKTRDAISTLSSEKYTFKLFDSKKIRITPIIRKVTNSFINFLYIFSFYINQTYITNIDCKEFLKLISNINSLISQEKLSFSLGTTGDKEILLDQIISFKDYGLVKIKNKIDEQLFFTKQERNNILNSNISLPPDKEILNNSNAEITPFLNFGKIDTNIHIISNENPEIYDNSYEIRTQWDLLNYLKQNLNLNLFLNDPLVLEKNEILNSTNMIHIFKFGKLTKDYPIYFGTKYLGKLYKGTNLTLNAISSLSNTFADNLVSNCKSVADGRITIQFIAGNAYNNFTNSNKENELELKIRQLEQENLSLKNQLTNKNFDAEECLISFIESTVDIEIEKDTRIVNLTSYIKTLEKRLSRRKDDASKEEIFGPPKIFADTEDSEYIEDLED